MKCPLKIDPKYFEIISKTMPSGLILPNNSIGSAAKMFRILLLSTRSLYLNVEISDNLKTLPNSPRCVVSKRVE